ncbi:hypothetical protein PsorP6_007311 [Peronosclerospora sorghi]|uniref:Uncharacterized protein n=1 Tax=Peronosclerospora sorghi TaxID=230839 RepID=A0ACC0WC12_9STRA|nr:hypothetical protein PsorP6_007311 [Peronosclerospora sorghi]
MLLLLVLFHGVRAAHEEKFMLRPLEDINQVVARFEFVVDEAFDLDNGASLFPQRPASAPRELPCQVAASYFLCRQMCGLALDLNSSGLAHAPFGARLQVALIGDADVQQRWRGITSEMSGIFSASLNEMDETVVTRLLSSSIPHELAGEELCIENLTPWLMLLPCQTVTGIGSLIDPLDALSGKYLSLSLFASRLSNGGLMMVQQDLTTVQRPDKHNRARWRLGSLFYGNNDSKHAISACPLADKSAIHMADSRSVVITDLCKEAVLFPSLWADGDNTSLRDSHKTQQDVVSVHRFLTGYGQVRGGIVVQLKNNHPSCMMRVTYHDVIPWYLRVYCHTFRVTASGGKKAEEMIRAFDLVPAELRGRPNQLRLEASLPANTTLVFSLQMEKSFLRYSEHPPDANRGFDIASGVATFNNIQRDRMEQSTCCELVRSPGFTTTLFTEPLLVLLPTA